MNGLSFYEFQLGDVYTPKSKVKHAVYSTNTQSFRHLKYNEFLVLSKFQTGSTKKVMENVKNMTFRKEEIEHPYNSADKNIRDTVLVFYSVNYDEQLLFFPNTAYRQLKLVA